MTPSLPPQVTCTAGTEGVTGTAARRGWLLTAAEDFWSPGAAAAALWSLAVQGADLYSLERREDSFSANGGISSKTSAWVGEGGVRYMWERGGGLDICGGGRRVRYMWERGGLDICGGRGRVRYMWERGG